MNAFQLYKQREGRLASLPVNPDFLEAGDIITVSGTPGLWIIGMVDNEKGKLTYRPLSSGLSEYKGETSIRMCKLVSREEGSNGSSLPYQVEFPFVKELVKKALAERDEELEQAALALTQRVKEIKAKTTRPDVKNPFNKALANASPETLKRIMDLLKEVNREDD